MATDVYQAPEMRHRAGERHVGLRDGGLASGLAAPRPSVRGLSPRLASCFGALLASSAVRCCALGSLAP